MRLKKVLLAFAFVFIVIVTVPAHAQTVIYVDDNAAPGGNGTSNFPFHNLPEAVEAARSLSGGIIQIRVAPGDYPVASTLVIDRSLDLEGSTQLVRQNLLPTGEVVAGTATRVYASNSNLTELVRVGRSDASVLSNLIIGGFIFEGTAFQSAGANGIEILLKRVQSYWIRDNVFRAPANFAMQSVASSGMVSGNHFSGVGTGAIFTGGYPASPSNVVFQGNRSVHNTLGGVLLNGVSINLPELGDLLNAVVRDNDLSDNTGMQGFGVRVYVIRRDPNAPGASQSSATVNGVVQNNRIVGNRVGIIIDAGFPRRVFQDVCDARVYSGTINLQLSGNALSNSLLRSGLITFTRQQAAQDHSLWAQFQYLHGARFTIMDQNRILSDRWIDHPTTDPYPSMLPGTCPGDATNEVLGNVLIYNGAVLPNGTNF